MDRSFRKKEAIVTSLTEEIVTELQFGHLSPKDLTGRLNDVTYSAIRQALCRMAKAGTVTKVGRGRYSLPNADEAGQVVSAAPIDGAAVSGASAALSNDRARQIHASLQSLWAEHLALDDPMNPDAWA